MNCLRLFLRLFPFQRLCPFLAFFPILAHADFDKEERLIYPAGFSTAETLHNGEFYLAPIPWGWVGYGLFDKLTLGWDYQATLLGLPAGFFRWELPFSSESNRFAFEAYGIAFPSGGFLQKANRDYQVQYNGGQYWTRLNWTAKLDS